MITIGSNKANFFDRQKVIDAVGKANARNLAKAGALIRKEAQQSLRYEKGSAPAGKPPHAHRTLVKVSKTKRTKSGAFRRQAVSPLRDRIEFIFDFGSKSTVVGPVKLGGKIGDAPASLEHGGASVVKSRGKLTRVFVAPHPFMKPALEKNRDKITPLWRDSVRPV